MRRGGDAPALAVSISSRVVGLVSTQVMKRSCRLAGADSSGLACEDVVWGELVSQERSTREGSKQRSTHVEHSPGPQPAVLVAADDAAFAVHDAGLAFVRLALMALERAQALARRTVKQAQRRVERRHEQRRRGGRQGQGRHRLCSASNGRAGARGQREPSAGESRET